MLGRPCRPPSSGSSVQGEVSKPKGGGAKLPQQQDQGRGLGAAGWRQVSSGELGWGVSKGGGVEAESDQEWAAELTEAQEQGRAARTPTPWTPMLLMTRV